jgi:hypothetical protein
MIPTKQERHISQFRWITVWLMPLPIVALILMVVTLLLMHFIDRSTLQIVLLTVAVIAYTAASVYLRRALPKLEKMFRSDSKVPGPH